MSNANLTKAREDKQDEFYTQSADIEKELKHYQRHFRGKVVYCNCDDPRSSGFFQYFFLNFKQLGLKRLIATCYRSDNWNLFSTGVSNHGFYLEFVGSGRCMPELKDIHPTPLKGDGDFRSEECIDLLRQADIVVTNPPFSLFREHIAQLIEHKKKFLIIGSKSAIVYKEVFKPIAQKKIWLGVTGGSMKFRVPDYYDGKLDENGQKWKTAPAIWFTNLNHGKQPKKLTLCKKYNPAEYPKYDNYNAINVAKIADIPMDYDGVMGVPVTFLMKYNPDQFTIVGSNRGVDQDPEGVYGRSTMLDGKEVFKRLFIQWLRRNQSI